MPCLRSFVFASCAVVALPIVSFASSARARAQTPTSPPPDTQPAPAAPLAPLPPPYVAPSVAPAAPAPAAPAPDERGVAVVAAPAQGGATAAQRKREDAETEAAEETPDRSVYLAISPLHLLLPVVELTAEVRLHRNIGVSVLGGYGTIRPSGSLTRYKVYEVGGQLTAYPIGHFDHGMQVGLETVYLGVAGDDSNGNVKVTAAASGFAAGPFIGYKLATRSGFSFNVQGGFEYVLVQADASSSSGATASAEETRWIPLVNANVGWSF